MNGHQEQAPLFGAFRRCDADDLRALLDALRKLQKPIGDSFWNLEQKIARIEDEIERRAACLL